MWYACCVVVADLARKEVEKYNLTGWYPTVVTDAGSEVSKAFDRAGRWDWMRCGCHLIHNAVQQGLTALHARYQNPAYRRECAMWEALERWDQDGVSATVQSVHTEPQCVSSSNS